MPEGLYLTMARLIEAGRRCRSTIDGASRDLTEFERAAARDWDNFYEKAQSENLLPAEGEESDAI